MSNHANLAYFAARALEERELSRTASHAGAASAHAEMADRYQALAAKFDGQLPKLRIAIS